MGCWCQGRNSLLPLLGISSQSLPAGCHCLPSSPHYRKAPDSSWPSQKRSLSNGSWCSRTYLPQSCPLGTPRLSKKTSNRKCESTAPWHLLPHDALPDSLFIPGHFSLSSTFSFPATWLILSNPSGYQTWRYRSEPQFWIWLKFFAINGYLANLGVLQGFCLKEAMTSPALRKSMNGQKWESPWFQRSNTLKERLLQVLAQQ